MDWNFLRFISTILFTAIYTQLYSLKYLFTVFTLRECTYNFYTFCLNVTVPCHGCTQLLPQSNFYVRLTHTTYLHLLSQQTNVVSFLESGITRLHLTSYLFCSFLCWGMPAQCTYIHTLVSLCPLIALG